MEASNRMYTEIVGGAVQFVIPVFQRDYNWDEEQCEQLWEDILRVGDDSRGEHFFGPVVYISTAGQSAAFTKWLLIDGQQRMTTVSLLMAAVRNHLRERPSPSLNPEQVDHYFLKNPYEREGCRSKLKLRERDEATLRWIVDEGDEPCRKSLTVENNYNFFLQKLRKADLDIVYAGVGKLAVVDVRLDREKDDPQQIFESLNSTGLDLAQADLVRNYVLMGLDEPLQTKLYNEYWHKIEKLYTGVAGQLDNFLRDFVAWSTKAQKQGRADNVYSSFRSAFDDCKRDPNELENLLDRMTRLSRHHAAFTVGTGEYGRVTERLARLRKQATTPAILVMRLLDGYEQKSLNGESLDEALDLIESYVVRRDVCGFQTRSYWQRFAELAYGLQDRDCLQSLKVNLHSLPNSYAFPTDREFAHALEEGNLYGRRVCRTVLERLENAESREQMDTSVYTIEHIMPQNPDLSDDWKRMLGPGWENVHPTWLHRLGNLTLTACNERYSDRPFHEKQTIEHGFNDSPLRLNQDVRYKEQWTVNEMKERGERLANRAMRIWPSLEVQDELVREARVAGLRREGEGIQATRDHMDEDARNLFDKFHELVMGLDENVIEVAIPKSVSYHSPSAEFFCEILPRTRWILALFPIAAEEAVDCEIVVGDAAQRRYFVNARHDAGCYVYIRSIEDVLACIPLVRQALAAAGY